LQHKVARELGLNHFKKSEFCDEENAAMYARILFMVGEFQLALNELIKADFLVESVHLAIALKELGLIATRH